MVQMTKSFDFSRNNQNLSFVEKIEVSIEIPILHDPNA